MHVPVWLGNGGTVCAEWDGLVQGWELQLLCRWRFGAGSQIQRLCQCRVLGGGGWETGVPDAANALTTRAA